MGLLPVLEDHSFFIFQHILIDFAVSDTLIVGVFFTDHFGSSLNNYGVV